MAVRRWRHEPPTITVVGPHRILTKATPLRTRPLFKLAAAGLVVGLLAAACGDDTTESPSSSPTASETVAAKDGPPITVGSFNFGESRILAEIYAQTLEANGYTVQRSLDLGTREEILPEIGSGNIDLLPEYISSALIVGFGQDPALDTTEGAAALATAFADAHGAVVLDPAPGEDANAFVTTEEFATANGLTTIGDLAGVDAVTFQGPPECESRDTCFAGLTGTYGLTNVTFELVGEGSVRVENLKQGNADVILLFTTQAVLAVEDFVVLEDDMGIFGVENIIPVISGEVADAHGQQLQDVLNEVSALITTDALIEMNRRVDVDLEDPADVAADFLAANA